MSIIATHENFEGLFNETRAGRAILYIQTYTHIIRIDRRAIERFEKGGFEILKPDRDGKGFRVAAGRRFDYVFQGQLRASFPDLCPDAKP